MQDRDPTELPERAGRTPRQRWMAVLARADAEALDRLLGGIPLPAYRVLRGPEAGLVMVRGRQGGGGAAFNLGEMTVTRCTVRTEAGRIGHAYIAGQRARQAELAALIDAMMQDPDFHDALESQVIAQLAAAQEDARARTARKAAATRVDFFALATMRA